MKIALAILVFTFVVMPRVHATPLNNLEQKTAPVKAVGQRTNVQEPMKPTTPVETPAAQPVQVQEEPQPVMVEAAKTLETPSDHETLMIQAGINKADFAAVEYIVSHESGWSATVWNGSGSGAYGLCQSLPAQKMASAGTDYLDNPVTQLRWCSSYAQSRYGSWWAAQAFWEVFRYW